MNIIKNLCSDILTLECQEYNEVLDYSILYYAPDRATSTEYFLDDIVLPVNKSGIYLQCVQPGISSSTTINPSTQKSARTTDGTVVWKTVPGKLSFQSGEVIASSTWTSDIPLEIYHSGITGKFSVGDRVLGGTSGAIGTIAIPSTDLSIFIKDITGTFEIDETLTVVDLNNEATGTGDTVISTVVGLMGTLANGAYSSYTTTIWLGPIDTRLSSVILTNVVETSSSPVRTFEKNIKIPLI